MPFFFELEFDEQYSLIIISVILTACSSLSSFQEQSDIELNHHTFKTTCNGIAETFDSCYKKQKNL